MNSACARESRDPAAGSVAFPVPHQEARTQTRMLRLLMVILVSLLCAGARAQGRIECRRLPSRIMNRPVGYCAFLPPGYEAANLARRYPLLYFLHGLGGNERSLLDSGIWGLVEDLRSQHKIGGFLIVAPEGDSSFYINSRDKRTLYSDFFLREFIPSIERRYRVRRDRGGRAISGISMGGYGALRFAFADPRLFSSVSVESAALWVRPPRWLDSAAAGSAPQARMLGAIFGHPLDPRFWSANDPLALARRNAARLKGLSIYFDCGTEDDYGFERGASALDRELTASGIPHEFHLYPGTHSASYFLAHIAASIIFAWQSFHPESRRHEDRAVLSEPGFARQRFTDWNVHGGFFPHLNGNGLLTPGDWLEAAWRGRGVRRSGDIDGGVHHS